MQFELHWKNHQYHRLKMIPVMVFLSAKLAWLVPWKPNDSDSHSTIDNGVLQWSKDLFHGFCLVGCHNTMMLNSISTTCSRQQQINIKGPYYWPFVRGSTVTSGFPSQKASNVESIIMPWKPYDWDSYSTINSGVSAGYQDLYSRFCLEGNQQGSFGCYYAIEHVAWW